VGTENRDRNEVYTATDGQKDGTQRDADNIQLSFFDAVVPAMNTQNNESASDNHPPHADDNLSQIQPHVDEHDMPPMETMEVASDMPENLADEAVEDESLGQRLRAAREARGMTREEAASRTKLQLSVIDSLERDHFERIGHGVYLRGYLQKYLALLGLPLILADRVLQDHSNLPPLTTSGTISRPRYLFQRYSGSALYLVLTGVIIVPAVLLAMRAGFDSNLVRIAPLDSSENSSVAHNDTELKLPSPTAPVGDMPQTPSQQSSAAEERPLAASMTPFASSPVVEAPKQSVEAATPAGQHSLKITLGEASWVEVTTADGQKLDYGLLAAGTTHIYHSAQSIDARLGNITGASVEVDGKAQDLTAFRHANVAHFKLSGGDTTLSHSGG
jgi:cytoskeleton protein RodZ